MATNAETELKIPFMALPVGFRPVDEGGGDEFLIGNHDVLAVPGLQRAGAHVDLAQCALQFNDSEIEPYLANVETDVHEHLRHRVGARPLWSGGDRERP